MAFWWRVDVGPTLNAGLVALWFFRGSGPVLLRNPIFLWFFGGGGVRTPVPPPLWIRTWLCLYARQIRGSHKLKRNTWEVIKKLLKGKHNSLLASSDFCLCWDNLCKQSAPRSVFLIFFVKVYFEKSQQKTKAWVNTQHATSLGHPFSNNLAKPAWYHLGPLLARQRNVIWMAFLWRADRGPLLRLS